MKTEIFEILKPNECLIVERDNDRILVVSNRNGALIVEWVSLHVGSFKEME